MKLENLTRATKLNHERDIYVNYINDLNDIIAYYETTEFSQKTFLIATRERFVEHSNYGFAPKHLLLKCLKDSKKYWESKIADIDKEIATL